TGRDGFSEGEVYDLVERFAKLGAKVEALGFDSAFEAAVFMALEQIILSPEAQRQSQDQQQSAYIETIAELFSRDLVNEEPHTDEELHRIIAYLQERRRQFPSAESVPKSKRTKSIPSVEAGNRGEDQWYDPWI